MPLSPRILFLYALVLFGLVAPLFGAPCQPVTGDAASDLLKKVTKEGDKVNVSVFGKIARLQSDEAFEASKDATTKVKKEPTLNQAYGAFVEYSDSSHRKRAIEFLAKDAMRHRKKYNQRAAARGLASFGGEAERELLRLLQEHKKEEVRAIVVWPLLDVLGEMNSAEGLSLLMNNANARGRKGGQLVGALTKFDSSEAIDAMVLAIGSSDVPLIWRDLLVLRIAELKTSEVNDCFVRLLESSDLSLLMTAIEQAGERKLLNTESALMRQIRSDEPIVVRAAVVALSKFVQDSDAWRKSLRMLAKDKRSAARMGAATALAAHRSPESLELLYGLVSDPDHAVRIVAVQEAGNLRRKDVIPLLIERMPHEHGRLQDHVAQVLRLVTGEDFGTGARWRKWWADSADTFVIPDYDKALAAERARVVHENAGGTQTSFYGLDIVSKRVCFVMDTSGSMDAVTSVQSEGTVSGGASESTRIEVAKVQLAKAVSGLADEMLFNMVFFSGGAKAWKKSLTEMEKSSRAAALKHVIKQKAGGGTAVYDALILAFQDDQVDTIYLLTDGAPSAGEITDPVRIAKEIKRLNSTRLVQINCISIGQRSELLRTLAADSGGTYREVL